MQYSSAPATPTGSPTAMPSCSQQLHSLSPAKCTQKSQWGIITFLTYSVSHFTVIFYREDVWDNHTQYVLKIHVLSLQMSLTVSIIVSSEELNKCSCTLIFNALNLAKSHLKWKCFPNVVVLWNHLLIWSVKSVFFSLSLWVANIVLKELYYNNIEKASNNSN